MSRGEVSRYAEDALEALIAAAQPGDRLAPERQLAASLGVSRSTVRLALLKLAVEGLVRAEQGRGYFVTGGGS